MINIPVPTLAQALSQVKVDISLLKEQGLAPETLPDATDELSVFGTLLLLIAQVRVDTSSGYATFIPNAFPATAQGGSLDLHALGMGASRRKASRASGVVTLTCEVLQFVPSGTYLITPDRADYPAFRTTLAVTLNPGTPASVPVECTILGEAGNLPSGALSAFSGISPTSEISIETPEGWLTSPGREEEGDESLRRRLALMWPALSGTGIDAVYELLALETEGVAEAKVLGGNPDGQATARVYVRADNGVPSLELLSAIQAKVDRKKPITAKIDVLPAELVDININMRIWVRGTILSVNSKYQSRLSAYAATIPLGGTFYPSLLVAYLSTFPDTEGVSIDLSPVTMSSGQIPNLILGTLDQQVV